jgi:hypothetical protein
MAFVPGSMLNRNKPDLETPHRIDREPSGFNDEALWSLFRSDGTEAEALVLCLTRFLEANRSTPDQVRGRLALENALMTKAPS